MISGSHHDVRDGADCTGLCWHRYRVVEDGHAQATGWVVVPSARYQKHENDLGMTIRHKLAGQLEEEGDEIAGPAGLQYAGNAEYGSWQDGTTKTWSFNLPSRWLDGRLCTPIA